MPLAGAEFIEWYQRPIDEDEPMAIKSREAQRGASFQSVSSQLAAPSPFSLVEVL
jgi:hypothetical protein